MLILTDEMMELLEYNRVNGKSNRMPVMAKCH